MRITKIESSGGNCWKVTTDGPAVNPLWIQYVTVPTGEDITTWLNEVWLPQTDAVVRRAWGLPDEF